MSSTGTADRIEQRVLPDRPNGTFRPMHIPLLGSTRKWSEKLVAAILIRYPSVLEEDNDQPRSASPKTSVQIPLAIRLVAAVPSDTFRALSQSCLAPHKRCPAQNKLHNAPDISRSLELQKIRQHPSRPCLAFGKPLAEAFQHERADTLERQGKCLMILYLPQLRMPQRSILRVANA